MNQCSKILLFEYTIHQLIEWYKEVCPDADRLLCSHFSRLASLKLLFLVATVQDKRTHSGDLLDIFDNFCAMQYGPVEVDVYSAIVRKETSYYNFGNRMLSLKSEKTDFTSLCIEFTNRVDNAIEVLRNINPILILNTPFQLVEITHKWYAWQSAMDTAEWFGKGSEPMSTESIRNSTPYYG